MNRIIKTFTIDDWSFKIVTQWYHFQHYANIYPSSHRCGNMVKYGKRNGKYYIYCRRCKQSMPESTYDLFEIYDRALMAGFPIPE